MFDEHMFDRPLNKQEKALLKWLKSQMQQAKEKQDTIEILRLTKEFIELAKKIDSGYFQNMRNNELPKMTAVDQCENCLKYFDAEVDTALYKHHLCQECYAAYPMYIDSDTENQI